MFGSKARRIKDLENKRSELRSEIGELKRVWEETKAQIKMLMARDDYKKKLIDNLLIKLGIDAVAPDTEPGELRGDANDVLSEEEVKLEKKHKKGEVEDYGEN